MSCGCANDPAVAALSVVLTAIGCNDDVVCSLSGSNVEFISGFMVGYEVFLPQRKLGDVSVERRRGRALCSVGADVCVVHGAD